MTLLEARNLFRTHLATLYVQAEIDAIFKGCIAHYFQWEPVKVGLSLINFFKQKKNRN